MALIAGIYSGRIASILGSRVMAAPLQYASGVAGLTLLSRRDKLEPIRPMSPRHGLIFMSIFHIRPCEAIFLDFVLLQSLRRLPFG